MSNTFKYLIFIIMTLGLFGCEDKKDFVFEEFKSEIQKQGLKIDSVDKDGIIHIKKGGSNLEISLENLRRDYDRDKDPKIISDFVKTITNYSPEIPTNWEQSKQNIFITFFPNDFDFKKTIHEKITDEFSKVYALNANDKFTWLTKEDLKNWNISQEELKKQANTNADSLLAKTPIKYETIDNRKLGMIESQHETLKGSLLFAPSMRAKIEKEIGFPFYAVLPVRDFCYIFSAKDFDFFAQRLGQTVVDEYNNSGYPITTEILKFTDTGIEAVGKYPTD